MRINISTSDSSSFVGIDLSGFNTPNTSLTQWPASGGFILDAFDAGGTKLATASNIKLTNVLPAALTGASIIYDPLNPMVAQQNATVTISITPAS